MVAGGWPGLTSGVNIMRFRFFAVIILSLSGKRCFIFSTSGSTGECRQYQWRQAIDNIKEKHRIYLQGWRVCNTTVGNECYVCFSCTDHSWMNYQRFLRMN